MNYIQTLHFLNDKLSYYKSRLEMMKHETFLMENYPHLTKRTEPFRAVDWYNTRTKIAKMEKLFPKVGKKVAQQFNQ